jgi:hypothetical protein
MFRKIRNIRNLGNVHIRGPHIVMSRIDAQNGLDFPFNYIRCDTGATHKNGSDSNGVQNIMLLTRFMGRMHSRANPISR